MPQSDERKKESYLEIIDSLVKNMQYGTITVIVQDGKVIHVTVYAGASILGDDTVIGHDSVIGGNAFITTSIRSNTRVSIKNQELAYKHGSRNATEIVQSDERYYII